MNENLSIDRLPPHALDMEQGVLGSVLLDPNIMPDARMKISCAEEFYDLRNATVWRAMIKRFDAEGMFNRVTVIEDLKKDLSMDGVDWIEYVNLLEDASPSPDNFEWFLKPMQDKYERRKAIQVCTSIISKCYDGLSDSSEVIDEAERAILAIRHRAYKPQVTMREAVSVAMEHIEKLMELKGMIAGISTGFIDLDKYTDGLHPGDMVLLAAYPSCGKTSLAMNIAECVAIEQGLPVGIFSLEMSMVQLVTRCICSRSSINLHDVRDGFLRESEYPRITSAAGKLSNANIYIDDASDMSVFQLRAKARQMVQQYGVKFFVVDYLQLLNAQGGSRRPESRQQEIEDVSNGIKSMAKELGVPVLVLSQLNDDGAVRGSRAPVQDADGLWKLEPDKDGKHVTLNIRKNRHGPRDVSVRLVFKKEFTRFESASKVSDEDFQETLM